jgi:hypothetical protein
MRSTGVVALFGVAVAMCSLAAGCETGNGVTQARRGRANTVIPAQFPAGMRQLPVRIGRFDVSTAVVIPPEMQEVGDEQLKALATTNIRHAMSACPSVDVHPDTGPSQTDDGQEILTVVGEICRIQLTGSIEEDLAGKWLWSGTSTVGSTKTVHRTLVLDIHYRLVRPNEVIAAAGSGNAEARVPITGTVTMGVENPEHNGSASRVLKDGKVDRGSLAPAFEMASSAGARALLDNYVARVSKPAAVVPTSAK